MTTVGLASELLPGPWCSVVVDYQTLSDLLRWGGKYFKENLLNSIENLCEEIYNLEDLTDRSDIFPHR